VWKKIHKITQEHVGRILKCYVARTKVFIHYEYLQRIEYVNISTRYARYTYECWGEYIHQWMNGYQHTCEDDKYYWEPVSDLELVVLGVPFPEDYIRESDRV
jgi:hypothetical protein